MFSIFERFSLGEKISGFAFCSNLIPPNQLPKAIKKIITPIHHKTIFCCFFIIWQKLKVVYNYKNCFISFQAKMSLIKRPLTDEENLEMTKNRLSREEDKLATTDIKFFDEEMIWYHKYFLNFRKNPELPKIMKEFDKYVDTLDNWYQKEDLDGILDKYFPFFKENFPKRNYWLYKMTPIYKNRSHLKRALIKLYKHSKETNWSLFVVLKEWKKKPKEILFDNYKNPELTYVFYLLLIKLLEEA